MKSTITTTEQHETTSQKSIERRKAKARRKVNESWQRMETTGIYRKAVVTSAGRCTTDRIACEVLDGIFINLNERNRDKSTVMQKRILRCIVEKRQAQAIHCKTRKSHDRKTAIAVVTNSSRCMERLYDLRFAC